MRKFVSNVKASEKVVKMFKLKNKKKCNNQKKCIYRNCESIESDNICEQLKNNGIANVFWNIKQLKITL